jgi:hypothetical protein
MPIFVEELIDWLKVPIGGNIEHAIDPLIAWHGRLMVVAWLVLVPISVLVARFYKVTPHQDWPRVLDNPFWFIWHKRLGYLALGLVILALAASMYDRKGIWPSISLHAFAGWAVVLLGISQIGNALLRGTHGGPIDPFTRKLKPPEEWDGDHYCMTQRRIVFEYFHKIMGYVAMLVSVSVILSGLYITDAPRWMWLCVILTLVAYAVAFALLQRSGLCVDTYQAIWGLDRSLPGNLRKRPIGLGVRRDKR